MEHPPLVAAQTAPFAVHLTTLADFQAMTTGRPHLELTPETGGSATVLLGTEALRPGAFRVEGHAARGGRYRWRFRWTPRMQPIGTTSAPSRCSPDEVTARGR